MPTIVGNVFCVEDGKLVVKDNCPRVSIQLLLGALQESGEHYYWPIRIEPILKGLFPGLSSYNIPKSMRSDVELLPA